MRLDALLDLSSVVPNADPNWMPNISLPFATYLTPIPEGQKTSVSKYTHQRGGVSGGANQPGLLVSWWLSIWPTRDLSQNVIPGSSSPTSGHSHRQGRDNLTAETHHLPWTTESKCSFNFPRTRSPHRHASEEPLEAGHHHMGSQRLWAPRCEVSAEPPPFPNEHSPSSPHPPR